MRLNCCDIIEIIEVCGTFLLFGLFRLTFATFFNDHPRGKWLKTINLMEKLTKKLFKKGKLKISNV